jgi:hypothetical protein
VLLQKPHLHNRERRLTGRQSKENCYTHRAGDEEQAAS